MSSSQDNIEPQTVWHNTSSIYFHLFDSDSRQEDAEDDVPITNDFLRRYKEAYCQMKAEKMWKLASGKVVETTLYHLNAKTNSKFRILGSFLPF